MPRFEEAPTAEKCVDSELQYRNSVLSQASGLLTLGFDVYIYFEYIAQDPFSGGPLNDSEGWPIRTEEIYHGQVLAAEQDAAIVRVDGYGKFLPAVTHRNIGKRVMRPFAAPDTKMITTSETTGYTLIYSGSGGANWLF